MKFLSILAAASLALSPAIVMAGSMDKESDNSRPISGSLAVEPLDDDEIPAGAIVVGGLVLLGGVVIGFAGGNGNGDGNATPATAGNQDQ